MTTSGILEVWWSWWCVEEVESIRVMVEGLVLLDEDLERERRDLKNISSFTKRDIRLKTLIKSQMGRIP